MINIFVFLDINRFENESSAASALKKLHQLDVLGSKLVVVYAQKKSNDWTDVPGDDDTVKNRCIKIKFNMLVELLKFSMPRIDEVDSQKCYENFLHNLNAWSLPMDLSQPPPSHLL